MRVNIAVILSFVTLAIVCNLSFRYEETLARGGLVNDHIDEAALVFESQIHLAGWPTKFWVVNELSNGFRVEQFSWPRLLINALAWFSACSIVLAYMHWRKRSFDRSGTSDRTKTLTIIDLFVATSVLALPFGYYQLLSMRRSADEELAKRIKETGGEYRLTSNLPSFLNGISESITTPFLRLTEVALDSPNDALLQEVLDSAELRLIRLSGDSYDLRQLDNLASLPFLEEVRVAGRMVDATFMAHLGQAKHLQSLNLMRTNVNDAALSLLGEMPCLNSLDIVHTDALLNESAVPEWATNLKVVRLPRPPVGGAASIVIKDWPLLEDLVCSEFDEYRNRSPVSLELVNLPQLKQLKLDSLQLFDLNIHSTANLSAIIPVAWQLETRVAEAADPGPGVWLRRLEVSDAPSLAEVFVLGTDLKQLRLHSTEPSKLVLALERDDTSSQAFYFDDEGASAPDSATSAMCQQWIDDLAESAGPRELVLRNVPMPGLDLSPLSKNASLEILDFTDTRTGRLQLESLQGLNRLRELRFDDWMVDGAMLAGLAKRLPRLERILIDSNQISRLRLEDHKFLTRIFKPRAYNPTYRPQPSLQALRLVNMPRINEIFEFGDSALYVHVEKAPQVAGLVFHAGLPSRMQIESLTNLRVFAGGGDNLTEEIVDEILRCKNMLILTLAHTELSQQQIRRVANLQQLRYLCLTGTNLRNEDVLRWPVLPNLQVLRLDDTNVDREALPYITRLPSLVELRVKGLNEMGIETLAEIENLSRLTLQNSHITLQCIDSLAKMKNLTRLRFDHCQIDDGVLAMIPSKLTRALTSVDLYGSTLSPRDLSSFAEKESFRFIGVAFVNADPDAVGAIVNEHPRVIDELHSRHVLGALEWEFNTETGVVDPAGYLSGTAPAEFSDAEYSANEAFPATDVEYGLLPQGSGSLPFWLGWELSRLLTKQPADNKL